MRSFCAASQSLGTAFVAGLLAGAPAMAGENLRFGLDWLPNAEHCEYRRRRESALNAIVALAPTHRDGQRLRPRHRKLRSHLLTFLDHPEVRADNSGSERELRSTTIYPKVTGRFGSDRGPICSQTCAPSSVPPHAGA